MRRGERQWTIRCSDALGDERLAPSVGPYRVEVVEPLRRIRLVCDGDDHGLGFDLRWEGSFPAVMEQPHVMRAGTRAILDASRFAQVGTWEGVLRIEGDELSVSPDVWVGTRDRSWGIRPVGEGEPAGRPADDPTAGLWWLYVPLRFDDFAVVVIVQEDADGYRTLNDATRVWPDGRVEQLGWPEVEITYRSATRLPERAAHPPDRAGRQAARPRGRLARLRRPPRRRRLRRRPRLGSRAMAGTRAGSRVRCTTSPTRRSWPGCPTG